jgi:queuine tRNA-ribosyltransferase
MPTRAGRHGQVFTRYGRLNLRNAKHSEDPTPLDPESKCAASNTYSKAYLHHLVRSNEILGMMLLTWHNLAYYQDLMAGLRKAIGEGRLDDYVSEVKEGWAKGEREGEAEPVEHADNIATVPAG